MTSKGFLAPINRQGINKGDIGPLAKCSFEDTTDQLIKASIFGEKDNLTGVSSNIMLGQTIPSGTGFTDILLDGSWMLDNLKSIAEAKEDTLEDIEDIDNIGDIDGIDGMITLDEGGCEVENFKFSFE